MQQDIDIIEQIWQTRDKLVYDSLEMELVHQKVSNVINLLNLGIIRVCEYHNNNWIVHQWIKKAILLYFQINKSQIYNGDSIKWYDKVPPKFSSTSEEEFKNYGCRIVPGAFIRTGAYIARNVIVMPSFINIGAYIDEGSMIDTWATIGSCAQIGKNCHISGGTGIGGVLEPIQNNPVIIENNCFIGARSEVVEGVIVEEGAVIGMGVFIGASTKIVNRETGEIIYGRVPAYSVVVPGTLPATDATKPALYCAVIVKQVDASTRKKTAINELLRC
ncbi:2,3,4,5-tetrahydropyridine-2,6-dicarboxylate N-succinyltransferase [Candidatus Trichorickettsia mobilis]|uniref:2,3,4,5-tetrahydropyridine-2,6-dicarboxylate N-succinyltransferase n=1 Tax=Candidatus Trichorickettsia mobilis TaxID=1346319 RepID=A0ABZ0UTQ6_9RICK|nr:2,3,4,5-tetrahydropyridine-2,6-dicarboxylate N-succinyltransferase [Candidatus Trichorickettsia mobilis]